MSQLPSGLDWGDGIDGRIGTPSPAKAVLSFSPGLGPVDINYGSAAVIEEEPDSPTLERAEQATLEHRFTLSWDEALNRIEHLGRGTLLVDSMGRTTKVMSAKIQKMKGRMARLTVVSEAISFDTPPDQFQIVPVELGIDIIKHPRYLYAFIGSEGYGGATEQLNQQVIRLLQDYRENPTAAYRTAIAKILRDSIGVKTSGPVGTMEPYIVNGSLVPGYTVWGTNMAKRAAMEILIKYWRGLETPYVVGYQITWTQFFFRPPYLNPGGYIENPMYDAVPQLPNYFWSPDYPPSGRTIFDYISSVNPQCYSSNGHVSGSPDISWLRKADEIFYERTWFRVQRTWIGSPVGYWDPQIYSALSRPSVPDDYIPLSDVS